MFEPTHQHADGGLYKYISSCSGKPGDEWVAGVVYQSMDGSPRWTTAERWEERFTPLTKTGTTGYDLRVDRAIDIENSDGELVCSFMFHVADLADVRLFWASAGPRKDSVMRKEEEEHLIRVLRAMSEQIAVGLHLRDHDYPDMLGDVNAFHAKYGQEYTGKPRLLEDDLFDFRVKFHAEETTEYADEQELLKGAVIRQDRRDVVHHLNQQLDALCDAAWVILGTADLQFGRKATYEAWKRVVTANMKKVRKAQTEDGDGSVDSGREPKYDIVKPKGWLAPDHSDLVEDNAIFDSWYEDEPVETNTYNADAEAPAPSIQA